MVPPRPGSLWISRNFTSRKTSWSEPERWRRRSGNPRRQAPGACGRGGGPRPGPPKLRREWASWRLSGSSHRPCRPGVRTAGGSFGDAWRLVPCLRHRAPLPADWIPPLTLVLLTGFVSANRSCADTGYDLKWAGPFGRRDAIRIANGRVAPTCRSPASRRRCRGGTRSGLRTEESPRPVGHRRPGGDAEEGRDPDCERKSRPDLSVTGVPAAMPKRDAIRTANGRVAPTCRSPASRRRCRGGARSGLRTEESPRPVGHRRPGGDAEEGRDPDCERKSRPDLSVTGVPAAMPRRDAIRIANGRVAPTCRSPASRRRCRRGTRSGLRTEESDRPVGHRRPGGDAEEGRDPDCERKSRPGEPPRSSACWWPPGWCWRPAASTFTADLRPSTGGGHHQGGKQPDACPQAGTVNCSRRIQFPGGQARQVGVLFATGLRISNPDAGWTAVAARSVCIAARNPKAAPGTGG